MTDAALFLLVHSFRNWLRGVGRQLRNPRYAIALAIGIGYLALMRFGQSHGGGGAIPTGAVVTGGSIFVAVIVVKWWVFGADRLALAFSPAEIQFLFPAPVSRPALLTFKLIRAQRMVLLNVLVWTLLLRRVDDTEPGAIPYAIGMWVAFCTLFFHRLGVALTRDTVIERGRAGITRAWPAALVFVGLGLTVWLTAHRLGGFSALSVPAGPFSAVEALSSATPLRWVLAPFRIPFLPLTATSTAAWLARLVPALLLLVLHWFWIVRADRAFEEAALAASVRREELLERWKRQGTAATPSRHGPRKWLTLPRTGHPVSAIIWKNLTRLLRTMSPSVVILLALVVALGVAASLFEAGQQPGILTLVGSLTLGWAAALVIMGPQWVRVDLRGELDHLSLLRTWPLSGTTLLMAQVSSSTLVLTGLQLLLGGIGLLTLSLAQSITLPPLQFGVLMVIGAVALTSINLVALCIQNVAAVLYPAWVRTEIRPGGIEQMGQHLLTAGLSLLILLLLAAGPALLGGTVGYVLAPALQFWAVVPGALLSTAGLVLEAFLLLDWAGERFERLDPSTLPR
jgi:ABC-2 type transport system permease protein